MIAVKEHRKMDAILSYLELKNIYTYTPEDNEKKTETLQSNKKFRIIDVVRICFTALFCSL